MRLHRSPLLPLTAGLVVLVLGTAIPACSRHGHSPASGDSGGGTTSARFIHLAPGLSKIDIYVNQAATPLETLGFTKAGDYHEIPAGTVTLTLVERDPAAVPPSHTLTLDVPENAPGTIPIHEAPDGLTAVFLAEPTDPLDPRIVPFPPPRFQVVHSAAALGVLDVYMPEDQIYLYGDGGGRPGDPMEQVYQGLLPGEATGFFGHYTSSPTILDVGQDGVPDHLFDLTAASLTDVTTFFITSDVNDAVFLAVLDAEGTISIVEAQAP